MPTIAPLGVLSALCIVASSVATYSASPSCNGSSDLVQSLPLTDFTSLPFCMFSGTVDISANKSIFYWLTESEQNAALDPLVLWFNGGPGCSSMAGMFTELGPFYPQLNGSLSRNAFSWNRVANVLYVDSPAGVGFSQAKDAAAYQTGDKQTAADALAFLKGFLNVHPEYTGREIWITGESYAGHYVPDLATAILADPGYTSQALNLVGFLVGNPATNDLWQFDGGSNFLELYNANFLSDETFASLQTECHGSNPFDGNLTAGCKQIFARATDESAADITNNFDIYADVCSSGHTRNQLQALHAHRQKHGLERGSQMQGDSVAVRDESRGSSGFPQGVGLTDPCIDQYLVTYLNNAEVQQAIHVQPAQYQVCSDDVQYGYTLTVIEQYKRFTESSNLKILVYSGDVDTAVAAKGTRAWVKSLRLQTEVPWVRWTVGEQLAGFTEVYQGLTFATVRNAGHQVPQYQPERALAMFHRFLVNYTLIV